MTERSASKAQAIIAEVRRRIVDREWRQGDRIPDEAELAVEFGVARATVNKALQTLAEEGLLDRKRRAGTHVTVNPARKATLTIPIVREQIEQAGMVYSHRLVAQRRSPLPADVARRMALPQGQPLIHLRTVHFGDDRPFQIEDRWLNPEAAPGSDAVDFQRINANEWLVRNFPWSRADMAFSAENANARDARLLDTRPGTALLILERTTWNDLGAITSVRLAFHPGYRLIATP
ncbi:MULTISPECIES: GntR family transcriptional regulator [unclassified Paracoccus (in: a-proteobacteria)]|uniref:GntR family transcriptional regulator n=1 Tax=unclassified Paracoccus (in: a-proteobacteria) TaxID=2688777 RepID=UPI00135436AB|nr:MULTISPECIES: GntR family transcriptional regulator [unclassified Paracoccus (in: a-proteobacteria)]UXU75384.1 GntR family transcriptional regulator [Paracoccus sp. SMMA_5]UXU81288.1 GntR family transcriptional regulator [Paracoccus sp. SMMA_5_TC]